MRPLEGDAFLHSQMKETPGLPSARSKAKSPLGRASAPTTVCEFRDGWFKSYTITPEDFGFARCTKQDLVGGTPEENAAITRAILGGEQGPKRNAVLMNAGAALYIAGKAEPLRAGVALAGELIDSGRALETLEKLIEVSNRPEAEA